MTQLQQTSVMGLKKPLEQESGRTRLYAQYRHQPEGQQETNFHGVNSSMRNALSSWVTSAGTAWMPSC